MGFRELEAAGCAQRGGILRRWAGEGGEGGERLGLGWGGVGRAEEAEERVRGEAGEIVYMIRYSIDLRGPL